MIISYEKFVDDFSPTINTFDEDRGYNGTLFETFGPEWEHVKIQKENHIWTLIDGENNNSWIIPGFHIVDRIGYFICQIAWTNEDIIVNDNELIAVNECSAIGFHFINTQLKINQTEIKDSWILSQKFLAHYMAEYAEEDSGCMRGYITENDFRTVLTEYIEDVLDIMEDIFIDALYDYQIDYENYKVNITTINLNSSTNK